MEYSVLFYGYYDSGLNEPYHAPPPNPHPHLSFLHYKLPLAYVIIMISLFVIYCIAILIKYIISTYMTMLDRNIILSLTGVSSFWSLLTIQIWHFRQKKV